MDRTNHSSLKAAIRNRPIGIAIIAILNIISGIFMILAGSGLARFTGGALMTNAPQTAEQVGAEAGLGIASILYLLLGVVTLIVAIGLWQLKPWAWKVAIIVSLISLVMALVSGFQNGFTTAQIISIVLQAIILYYLYSVRSHFNRAAV